MNNIILSGKSINNVICGETIFTYNLSDGRAQLFKVTTKEDKGVSWELTNSDGEKMIIPKNQVIYVTIPLNVMLVVFGIILLITAIIFNKLFLVLLEYL